MREMRSFSKLGDCVFVWFWIFVVFRIAYHIQVKLFLLLPVDHPIVSSFDFVLNFSQGLEIASFDALKQLEMDSGELSFNSFVKDINEIGMHLVVEKVRETEIRKLESNFV